MTTYVDFVPTQQSAFQFQLTLDGTDYSATITWNTFGQRWYINLYDLAGNLIFAKALVGSDVPTNILSITWSNGRTTIVTDSPHGFTIGAQVPVLLAGITPSGLNGTYDAAIVDETTLIFPLAADPGPISIPGTVGFDVNLALGYFDTSTLVYREANAQFEIAP